jgi:hypothetical protein
VGAGGCNSPRLPGDSGRTSGIGAVAKQLRTAFSTPLDQEDLCILSERLGAVLTAAKNVVREAEVLALDLDQAPDISPSRWRP